VSIFASAGGAVATIGIAIGARFRDVDAVVVVIVAMATTAILVLFKDRACRFFS